MTRDRDDRPVTHGDVTRWLGWAAVVVVGCLVFVLLVDWLTS